MRGLYMHLGVREGQDVSGARLDGKRITVAEGLAILGRAARASSPVPSLRSPEGTSVRAEGQADHDLNIAGAGASVISNRGQNFQ
jgi:hypothetical protein